MSSHATGANRSASLSGDINGDGSIDIVTTNYYSNDISVLLGDGNGNFGAAVSYGGAGSYPYFVALGDFNRDNKLDAAVASSVQLK
ncbi:MAG: VCBS repeat-containing protein [Chloracidobacterium sp.]|nr:VCBS repeat-containing protein [Chloracidobacterium sp.]